MIQRGSDVMIDSAAWTECLVCGACGWLCEQQNGIPYNGDKEINALRHKKSCPVGQRLDSKGNWK